MPVPDALATVLGYHTDPSIRHCQRTSRAGRNYVTILDEAYRDRILKIMEDNGLDAVLKKGEPNVCLVTRSKKAWP